MHHFELTDICTVHGIACDQADDLERAATTPGCDCDALVWLGCVCDRDVEDVLA